MDPDGNFKVDFNVPMMAPKGEIDQKIYGAGFGFGVGSMNDDSTFEGKFGSTKRERLLEASDNDSAKFSFKPVVKEHTSEGIKIGIEFDNPDELSTTGNAEISMNIKEVSIFRTKADMTPLGKESFKDGVPELGGAVPPIITDKETATSVEETSEKAEEVLEAFNSGNFFIMLVLGGSMEQLWGMIRAVQMMALSALVNLKIPVNLFIFLGICIRFSQMDIYQGEEIYANNLVFKETEPINDAFNFFGIGDKNMIYNSGSYFLIQISIFVWVLVKFLINLLA
jgi:hypothetical protein